MLLLFFFFFSKKHLKTPIFFNFAAFTTQTRKKNNERWIRRLILRALIWIDFYNYLVNFNDIILPRNIHTPRGREDE